MTQAVEEQKEELGATCGQCKHWVHGEGEVGECYRNPPTVGENDGEYWLIRAFTVRDERACGEFKGAN